MASIEMGKMHQIHTLLCFTCLIFLFIKTTDGAYQPYKHTDPEFAASVYHLEKLVLEELEIIAAMSQNIKNDAHFENQVDEKTSYLQDFESSIVSPLDATFSMEQFALMLMKGYINKEYLANEIVKHPLKSYRTIRRFVRFINWFPNKSSEISADFQSPKRPTQLPKTSDLEASMESVLRLRQIFKFTVADLIEGNLGSMNTRSGLTIQHLYEIGEHAVKLKMFTHAVDLFDVVLQKCKGVSELSTECSAINMPGVIRMVENVIDDHDKVLTGSHLNYSDLSEVPPDSSPFVFDNVLKSYNSHHFKTRRNINIDLEFEEFAKKNKLSRKEMEMASSPFVYEKLCRGDTIPVLTLRKA